MNDYSKPLVCLLAVPAMLAGCASETDPLGGAAEVVEGFLDAAVAGNADAAADYALIEGDSEGFVIFTELLDSDELALRNAEIVEYGEPRLGEGPYGRDLLAVEIAVDVLYHDDPLPERGFSLGLVRENGRWYIKDVPYEWSFALQ